MHDARFPGESDEYRHARDELLRAEIDDLQRRLPCRGADGSQYPMATVFARRDGRIHHFWSSELFLVPSAPGQHPRHVDFMWPLWAVLDRTPEGRGTDWAPELDYL